MFFNVNAILYMNMKLSSGSPGGGDGVNVLLKIYSVCVRSEPGISFLASPAAD